jgi:hypothetical protein
VTQHADVAFRCKKCPATTGDGSNLFADFYEVRRHLNTEHAVRNVNYQVAIFTGLPQGSML